MYKEKHILNKTYSNHKVSRYLDVYETTLQTDGHGTVSASKLTGYASDDITLSATPNKYYALDNYTLTGASITGDTYKLVNSDVTAQANFIMTGVPVNNIYSGGSVDIVCPIHSYSGHTWFLHDVGVAINDPYVVLQFDYQTHINWAGHTNFKFTFSHFQGQPSCESVLDYCTSYSSQFTNTRKGILRSYNNSSRWPYKSEGYTMNVLPASGNAEIVVSRTDFAMNKHHYKYIGLRDGSSVSAYVDGTFYGYINQTNDPAYTTYLELAVTGDSTTAQMTNISYVSTSSWADAIAYNG